MSSVPNVDAVERAGHQRPSSAPRPPHVLAVAEGYQRWAPIYDSAPNPLLAREERYLTPLLPAVQDKHVLDVACGTGRWLERLLTHGARVGVGVDVSTAMLRIARRKSTLTGRLARADCLRLPFRASVFDFAICSFAVGHLRDLRSLVRELARVMKPSAEVFISDLHPEAYARGWRTGFRDAGSAVEIEMQPRATEEIIRVFHSGGFECLTHVPLCLGEPEKPIFAEAGKSHFFAEACRVPAVLVCHFRSAGLRRSLQVRNECTI